MSAASQPIPADAGAEPLDKPPFAEANAALDRLIHAAHAYHRHIAIEYCKGCPQCERYRTKYHDAVADYDRAICEMLG